MEAEGAAGFLRAHSLVMGAVGASVALVEVEGAEAVGRRLEPEEPEATAEAVEAR